MILLDSTLKSLEVVLTSAIATAQPVYTAHYVDLGADFSISAVSETDGTTNSGTAVTPVAAPASGHVRQIKFLSVYNNDTAAVEVTVRINNNGTTRILVKVTLQVGETLEYKSE